jgi:hypothetical protein
VDKLFVAPQKGCPDDRILVAILFNPTTTPNRPLALYWEPKPYLGLVRFYLNPYGLRGFQFSNSLQSVSIPSNPYGSKITEQALREGQLISWTLNSLIHTCSLRLLASLASLRLSTQRYRFYLPVKLFGLK